MKEIDPILTLPLEDAEQLLVDKIHANVLSGPQYSNFIETSDPTFQTMLKDISDLKVKVEEISSK